MTDHRAAISPGSGTGLDPRVAALAQGAVFGGLGRITQMVSADGTSAYTYDATSQLTAAAHDYRAHESYSYDANGNRTLSGYDTGDNNQLLSDGTYDYTYDDEGNRLTRTHISSGHVTEYAWDHRNRLISVTDYDDSENILQLVAYTYDLFNRRLSRALDTTSPFDLADVAIERFVYDDQWSAHSASGLRPNPFHLDTSHSNVVLDFLDPDGSGALPSALRSRHLFGAAVDQLLAQEDVTESLSSPDRVLWPLPDHLQTTRDLIDNAGDLREHYEYDSFGQVLSGDTSLTRYLFTAREHDPATALNYHRARHYDPAPGRWLSEDPIGFEGGDNNLVRFAGNLSSPQGDPSGMKPPSAVATYLYYLTHPWMMDDDLETGFYVAAGTAAVASAAAGGLAAAGIAAGGGLATGGAPVATTASIVIADTSAAAAAAGTSVVMADAAAAAAATSSSSVMANMAGAAASVGTGTLVASGQVATPLLVGSAVVPNSIYVTGGSTIAFVGHGSRHIATTLGIAQVESAIFSSLYTSTSGALVGQVIVSGTTVSYRAHMIDAIIRVGTYFIPKP